MRRLGATITAMVGLTILSAQRADVFRNRCEDFTQSAADQISSCNELMKIRFDYAIWRGLMMRAAAYFRSGDLENARKDYALAVRQVLNTGFYSAADRYASVAWTYAVLNVNVDEARAECDQALVLDPRNGFAFNTRGFMNLKTGRYQEALDDYNHALERSLTQDVALLYGLSDTRKQYALFGRGLAKVKLGDAAGGKADLDAANKIKPGIAVEFAAYGLKAE